MSTDLPGRLSSPDAVPSGPSFVSTLGNLLIAPRDAFTAILRRPSPWLPFILYIALQVAFTAVWASQMDAGEFLRNQAEETGQPAPPPQAVPFVRVMIWASPFVVVPILLLSMTLVLWLVFRFFYGSDVTFKQALTICSWASLIVGVVTLPLILGVMALKDDWNADPRHVLAANATLFVDRAATAKPLYALAQQVDLFVLWLVFLLASGFAVAMRKPTGSALWGVLLPWALLVAIAVGWAAIF